MATKNIQFQKGQETEILIERLLHDSEWMTIPVYRYKYDPEKEEDGAPSLIGKGNTKIVLPDILACKANKKVWVECKHELGANWTYTISRYDHGFAKRLYLNYLQVEQITGMPVWIIFHEVDQWLRTISDRGHFVTRGIGSADSEKYPPSTVNYPKNALRGMQLSQLKNIREQNFSNGQAYIYFPQDDLLKLGTVEYPQLEALENDQVQLSLFNS